MSLDRKDLRLKLDPDVHVGLSILAEARADGTGVQELGEEIVAEYVRRRIHDATVIAERAQRAGISGSLRAVSVKTGKVRE